MSRRPQLPRAARPAAAAALALLAAGCTPSFEQPWKVKDLRVLAIKAEPPDVLLDPPVSDIPSRRITALVVDPFHRTVPVSWEAWACTAKEMDCREDRHRVLVARRRSRLDRIAFDFKLTPALFDAARDADRFKGLVNGVSVHLTLVVRGARDQVAIAFTRLAYSTPFNPFTKLKPGQKLPDKVPNRNPVLTEVWADGVPIPEKGYTPPSGKEIVLQPRVAAGSKETYWTQTFRLDQPEFGVAERTEYLTYSYFVTDGKLSHHQTGGRPSPFGVTDKKLTDITSRWTTPNLRRVVQLWFIVRDDRGGVDWIHREAQVR